MPFNERNVIYMAESSNIRQAILELTNGWTDYKTINKLLKQYHRPSYVKAGLYILLWWNTARGEYIETDRDEIFPSNWETPPTSFFYQEWSKACKKAGLHVA